MIEHNLKGKQRKLIAVVPRKSLFGLNNEHHFNGFKVHDPSLTNGHDYYSRLLSNIGYMTRGDSGKGFAEDDSNYKQPIAYCVVVNSTNRKVFVYERAKDRSKYTEGRLSGLLSIGLGGHIEYEEEKDSNDPIATSMRRELEEEVDLGNRMMHPTLLGYINVEKDVHAVHFGLLYVIDTGSKDIKLKGEEASKSMFIPINSLERMIVSDSDIELEEWSRVALPEIRKYLYK